VRDVNYFHPLIVLMFLNIATNVAIHHVEGQELPRNKRFEKRT